MIQARYTEVLYNLLNNTTVKHLIDQAMSEYPMYTPENPKQFSLIPTREELNKRILEHYKYREIGFETVGRFIDELRIALNEIMPFYYQLFKSEDVMNGLDDIFGNLDVIESYNESSNGTTSNSSSNSSTGSSTANGSTSANSNTTLSDNSKNVRSSTPQGSINIVAKNIDNVNYADEVIWNKSGSTSSGSESAENESTATNESTSESASNGSTSGNIQHTLTRKGNQGVNTYAHDMGELRNIFMNITNDIINNPRIQELFMLIY